MKEFLTAEMVRDCLANLGKLTFEVTDACNLQCEYCGYGKLYGNYDQRENKRLPLSAATKLFDYLSEIWSSDYNTSVNKRVYVGFYGGEPLLNMAFVRGMIEHIEKREIPNRVFQYSMTTNAVLLDKYMDFLAEKKFELLISLDGNEENNSYRLDKNGRSVFGIVTRNISLLREKYPDYFEKHVNFNAVLHNRNSVKEIYDHIRTHYGKTPSVGELNRVGIKEEARAEFQHMQKDYYTSFIQADFSHDAIQDVAFDAPGFKDVMNYIFEYSGFVYQDYSDLYFGKLPKKIPTGTCLPFGKGMFVTVNGKILPCEHIGHEHPLGWIDGDEIHIDEQEIANLYNGFFRKIEKQCSACKIAGLCTQCIFNMDSLDTKPICNNRISRVGQLKNYSQFVMNFLRKNPDSYHKIMTEIILH